MARGYPAFWSTVLACPFLGSGLVVYRFDLGVAPQLGLPPALFGVFIVLVGVYVQFVSMPSGPTLRAGESILEERHPSQRVAVTKLLCGLPLLATGAYLLVETRLPYVYPTVALFTGLYVFSTGLYTYWTNTLTTYYLTQRRVIREFRFLSLVRKELPLRKIRGVEERKSPAEMLVGLGNVRVASAGGGRTLEVVVRNIEASSGFADRIRGLV